MVDLLVHPARAPLIGALHAPPDHELCELALLLAALCPAGTTSTLTTARHTALRAPAALCAPAALAALGVGVADRDGALSVTAAPMTPPRTPIDGGDGALLLPALAGVLCAQPFASRLEGDADTVAALIPQAARALRQRGANIEGTLDPTRVGSIAPPILIEPAQLFELTLDTVGTAGKIAALTSGVASGMDTTLAETLVSDPRLERLLVAMGAAIEAAGPALALYGGPLRGFVDAPPGCISGALSLFAAALGVADSVVTVRDVAADPIIAALRTSGMRMLAEGRGERLGTPIVELSVRGDTPISGLCVGGETARGTRASLPIIAALACACRGVSTIEQVPDDPVHGDRRAATLDMLRAFGIDAAATSEGLAVRDASTRRACTLRSRDPAIVEAATVLALTADGPSRIGDAECVVGSFPRFVTSLRALGARIELMS